ncbi:MAG: rRNA maturation RNase YbeY [Clostridiales Family XIII bacterium]|jgi:probable rRNA maturation factor|nr:rRNA maturation RNase YbeY [Clostridiales Family XIII bacterium]
MNIVFSDERMPGERVIGLMREAGGLCAAREGFDPEKMEVSVTFVDAAEMRELNRIYREIDRVTDVLSFPQYATRAEIPGDIYASIGDVVICSEQALLQADDFGHSPERELVYLFVHSVFHLLGYDHDSGGERAEMRAREEAVMKDLRLTR